MELEIKEMRAICEALTTYCDVLEYKEEKAKLAFAEGLLGRVTVELRDMIITKEEQGAK